MNRKLKAIIFIVAVLGAGGLYLLLRGNDVVKAPLASFFTPDWRDLGEIRVYGDGLPGYDVDRNGKPDYVESGFFPYVELYRKGGFDYTGGQLNIKATGANVTLPVMKFFATELAESSVGSVVIFDAADNSTGLRATVIVKTLGRSVSTYILVLESPEYTYRLADLLNEKGSGTFEKVEVEGSGIVRL